MVEFRSLCVRFCLYLFLFLFLLQISLSQFLHLPFFLFLLSLFPSFFFFLFPNHYFSASLYFFFFSAILSFSPLSRTLWFFSFVLPNRRCDMGPQLAINLCGIGGVYRWWVSFWTCVVCGVGF